MKKLLFISCMLTLATNAQNILWDKSFGGKHVDYLFDALPTADFGFILAGSSLSNATGDVATKNQGDYDYWLWKMDEYGDMVWQKSFGGNSYDLLKQVHHTKDGGFILGGTSKSTKSGDKTHDGFGLEDLWVIKLNAYGQIEWQQTIGGRGQDFLNCITPTTDGGYIIGATGSSDQLNEPFGKKGNNQGGLDYWVIKLDQKGDIRWQENFGGNYEDQLISVVPHANGYLVAGYSNSPANQQKSTINQGETDIWCLMLNLEGKIQWQKNYTNGTVNHLDAVIFTKDQHFVLAGDTNKADDNKQNKQDFYALKINTQGEIIWEETFSVATLNQLTGLTENKDGSLMLSGYGLPSQKGFNQKQTKRITGENDYILIKLSANGDEQWQKVIGSNGEDHLNKVIETRDGGYLMAGTSDGKASGDKRSGSDAKDFWLVKVQDPDKPLVEKPKMEAFPNPTNRFTNVIVGFEFDQATVTIADMAGRIIHQRTTNDRTVPIDLGNQPEGIYIVEIRSGEDKGSVKIVKTN